MGKLPTPVFLGFPCGSAGKESACNAGDLGSVPGLGRSPGEGKGYPLQYSSLENSMDCIVHGVAKSQTRLSDFRIHITSHIYIYAVFPSALCLMSHKPPCFPIPPVPTGPLPMLVLRVHALLAFKGPSFQGMACETGL